MKTKDKPFWKTKKLNEMNQDEWEALCDGCGKCCLEKTMHPVTKEIKTSNVACRLLDLNTAKCSKYNERFKYMDDCLKVTPKLIETTSWIPLTCSYRLVNEGKDLPDWHPLITNDINSTKDSGNSIVRKVKHPYFTRNYEDIEC